MQTTIDAAELSRLHCEPAPLLLELEQVGHANDIPRVSRETGRLLSTLVHAMQANRILEIGTAYGYSTLWMALAAPPAGRIWTIDPDRERTKIARTFIERGGKAHVVEFINQSAIEVLGAFTQRNLDIVFIDAIKEEYEDLLGLCMPLLKLSGLVVVDNLLRDDHLAQAFSKRFLNHPQLDATIIPLGHGTGLGARIE